MMIETWENYMYIVKKKLLTTPLAQKSNGEHKMLDFLFSLWYLPIFQWKEPWQRLDKMFWLLLINAKDEWQIMWLL